MGADKVRESSARGTFWEWAGLTRDMAWDYPLGLVAPANFALHVSRYLHESPATREHLAMVAVKNHRHAVPNPKAQMRFEITVEQALNAPRVVEPFGLYDCTPQSDGAAALLPEIGGSVLQEPWDFEHGRLVAAAGPDGEIFTLLTPPRD